MTRENYVTVKSCTCKWNHKLLKETSILIRPFVVTAIFCGTRQVDKNTRLCLGIWVANL